MRMLKYCAITSLVFLYIFVFLGITFDFLMWWKTIRFVNFFLIFLCGFFSLALFPTIWSSIVPKFDSIIVRPIHLIFVGLITFVNCILFIFILFTTVIGLKVIHLQEFSLAGYFVPGGHLLLNKTIMSPSINQIYSGKLETTWVNNGMDIEKRTYEVSEGDSIKHKAIERETTTIRAVIKIPYSVTPSTSLIWEFNGNTKIFANRNGTKSVYAGGPGGGTIYIDTDSLQIISSGKTVMEEIQQASFLGGLIEIKEKNRLLIWLSIVVFIFINYGSLRRAKLINFGIN